MRTVTYSENLTVTWTKEEFNRLQKVLSDKENLPPRNSGRGSGKNKATRGQIYAIKVLHWEGYTIKEIALALDMPQSLIWRILNV